jgi:hypothetical protein
LKSFGVFVLRGDAGWLRLGTYTKHVVMKIRFGANEVEVDTMEQLDELVLRYGGTTFAMKIRIGALEIDVDTLEQVKELVTRYGGKTGAAVFPGSRESGAPG